MDYETVFGYWEGWKVLEGVVSKYESELLWYFAEYLPSAN